MDISITGLTKTYGKQKAVDDISFSVQTGEILGFLGPNGAGKTTTMKIITDYYDRQGVTILSAETAQQNTHVCQSCSCPLGYALYLLVPGDDVQTMLDSGFRLEIR